MPSSPPEPEGQLGNTSPLWWIIPNVLAGMPMPFLDPLRRLNPSSALHEHDDELPTLHAAGIRAIVSLLNIPTDAAIFQSHGIDFLCLPIPDGHAPTHEQAQAFIRFVGKHRAADHPVVVHCEAGLGRTGTMLAVYLISKGESPESAINSVRRVEPAAIETSIQVRFLYDFAQSPKT